MGGHFGWKLRHLTQTTRDLWISLRLFFYIILLQFIIFCKRKYCLLCTFRFWSHLPDLPRLEVQQSPPPESSLRTRHSCWRWSPRSPSPSPACSPLRSRFHQNLLQLFPLLWNWKLGHQALLRYLWLGQRGARFQSHLCTEIFAWKCYAFEEKKHYMDIRIRTTPSKVLTSHSP